MGAVSRFRLTADVRWWALLALGVVISLSINPLGFVGGGWDDWQYLNAARCWRDFGPCLPHDHWQGRWPVIAAAALAISALGESRFSVGLSPFVESTACLALISLIGNKLWGKPLGWLAALLMLVTPAFSIQILDLAVEAPELGFSLLGFLALLYWIEDPRLSLAVAAAFCFSLAAQVRETGLVAGAFAATYALIRRRPSWSDALGAALAFAAPFLAEFIAYFLTTGDPFWRHRLSLQHAQIPSSELQIPVDTAKSPLFNRAYIANWRREPGIHVYWAIDGFLNLFANAKAGISLALVPILALFFRKLPRPTRKLAISLWATALLYAAVLIYVFAIDPKPRMMFVPLTLTNCALAILSWHGRREYLPLTVTVWTISALVGTLILYGHQSTWLVEGPARQWIRAHAGQLEIDRNTQRHLALLPEAQRLPDVGSGRRYFLYNSIVGCNAWVKISRLPSRSITALGEAKISRLAWLEPKLSGGLCLFRYNQLLTREQMLEAITRSRPDGRFIARMNG